MVYSVVDEDPDGAVLPPAARDRRRLTSDLLAMNSAVTLSEPLKDDVYTHELHTVATYRQDSEANLKSLVEAIVGMMESAVACRDASAPLRSSSDFRGSAEKTRAALVALGVSDPNLRIVIDALFRGALAAASPPARTTYK